MAAIRNSGIQWMRALAALLVVFDHCLFTLVEKAGAASDITPLAAMLGGTGVKLFFAISGFVMIVSSTKAFGANASGAFIQRRLIRIAPLYWITTCIYTAKLWLVGTPASLTDFVRSLFFIPYTNPGGEMQPIYGLGWTLNYEVFFYLIFAIGLLHSLRATLTLAGATLLILVFYGATLNIANEHAFGLLLYYWSRPIVLFFLAGMALPFIVARLRSRLALTQLAFGNACLISALLVVFALTIEHHYAIATPLQLLLLSLPVLVAALASTQTANRGFARLATTLGDASYSIYLTHSFAVGPLARMYAKLDIDTPILFVVTMLIVCSYLGILCFRYIETPIIRWLTAKSATA